jgi:hypothetical protein
VCSFWFNTTFSSFDSHLGSIFLNKNLSILVCNNAN